MKKLEIQIFLAHANEDEEAVLKLYERLKEAGYRPWLHKKDLIPGQNWRTVIPQVIAKSQLFIACLSQQSIAKQGFVQKEFKLALNKYAEMPQETIYIIPLRLDECQIPDLRQDEYGLNLRDIQWLDYWKDDGFENLERAITYRFKSLLSDKPLTQSQNFIQDLSSDVKLKMIYISGGRFIMGSPEEEEREKEKPKHEVTIQPFFMGKYPITQEQYRQVTGNNPSYFKSDNRPVENVFWNDAVEFCEILSQRTGREYRLPYEAEWEYACRAGTTTKYHFGNIITDKLANYGGNVGKTTPVGKYPPNDFGLYDMHGNVWELCQDDWHDNYQGAPINGSAWLSGDSSIKVVRGGSWYYSPGFCRSAYRNNNIRMHGSINDDVSFRVVSESGRT